MSTVLTPYLGGTAIELGNTWTKKLLPVGSISYKGRTLQFTRSYLQQLADAFSARAYDQVPLQLAGADNGHTNDPERTAGQITGMEVRPDGLWITAKVTPRGEAVLAGNPKLGVSARIVEDYDRADGRFFPAAIQHVLGTLDPRIPGMGAWAAVEASNDGTDAVLIDLSGCSWEGQEDPFAVELSGYGVKDESPWETAAVDQVLAELAELAGEAEAYGFGDVDEYLQSVAEGERQFTNFEAYRQAVELSQGSPEPAIDLSAAGTEELIADMDQLGASMAVRASSSAIELANIDLQMAAAEARSMDYRYAEASRPRRASGEQKLTSAYERIRQGNYLPGRSASFASGSQRDLLLSNLRDSAELGQPDWDGVLNGSVPCSALDSMSRCGARFHEAGCSALADISDVEAYKDELRITAMLPASQDSDATFSDHVEAATGQRLSHFGYSPWETGTSRRELISIGKRQVHGGDPDAGEPLEGGYSAGRQTAATVAFFKRAMGEERPYTSRLARVADQALRAQPRRMGPDSALRDEDFAPRAERPAARFRPDRLLEGSEPLSGSLQPVTRA